MNSNEHISRRFLDKFGIEPISKKVEKELNNLNTEGKILFFKFNHIDHGLTCRLECRLAYKLVDPTSYECRLKFDFKEVPYKVTVLKNVYNRKSSKKISSRSVNYLHDLEEKDIKSLIEEITIQSEEEENLTFIEKLKSLKDKILDKIN